ncbi:MAG TPA: hypothetical protein VEO94_06295 [Candidatus Dormibacteraeota bacterium]|nr:hypothetical protein [Candidatus Dormibacteraeota bacterium]
MEPTFRLAEHPDVDRLIDFMRQLYAHDGTPFDEPGARRALEGILRDRSLGRVWMIGVRALHLEMERGNVAAQALYRRHGFADHDRYLMTRWIGEIEP